MSQGTGAIGITVKVVARNPCPTHGYTHWDGKKTVKRNYLLHLIGFKDTNVWDGHADCKGGFIGSSEHAVSDMAVKAFAWGIQLNLLDTNETIKDTSGASNAETANTAVTTVNIRAGSGVTGAAFTDYQIESPLAGASGFNTAVINGISGSAFTVTSTLTNSSGGNLTYGNVGIEITLNSHVYLITHDQANGATGYIVSNLGTVAVTYTIAFS